MSAISIDSDSLEQLREPAFVGLLMTGAIVFSLGVAFLTIGIAINTAPPAPYVTPTDRYLLIGLSIAAIVGGGALVRFAGRVVGW